MTAPKCRSLVSLLTLFALALAWNGPGRAAEPGAAKPEDAEQLLLRIYDVQGLTLQVPDFPGPWLSWHYNYGGTLPVFRPPSQPPCITTTSLVDMIQARVLPESWKAGKASVEGTAGKLVVVATSEAHGRIEALFKDLRERHRVQLSVRALMLALDAKTAAALGRHKSPEFSPEEVEALVKSAGPKGLIAAPQLICFDGQRDNVWAGRSLSFAGGDGLEKCPGGDFSRKWLEGTVLDVRPTLLSDRSGADLELRFICCGAPAEKRIVSSTLGFPGLKESAIADDPTAKPAAEVKPPVTMAICAKSSSWLPSTPEWTLRTSLTAPLGKYVLAGMAPMPPADPGGKGATDARIAVVFVAVKATQPLAPPQVVPRDAPEDRPISLVYDVRELTAPITNFEGAILGLSGAESPCGDGDSGGGVYVAPSVESPAVPPGTIMEIVKRTFEPESWGVGGISVDEQNGILIVNHRPAIHRRVVELLATLRADQKRPLVVTGLILAVDDAAAAKLRARDGVEFTAEEMEAVAGSGKQLAAPRLLCYNGQRASLASARTVAYVSGLYATEELRGVPVLNRQSFGCTLDVRPLLGWDRKTATLEARLTWADGWEERESVVSLSASAVDARGKALSAENRLTSPSLGIWTARLVAVAPLGKYVLVRSFRQGDERGGGGKAPRNVLMFLKVDAADGGGR